MANPEITVCGRLTVAWDGEQLEGRLPGRQGRLIFAYMVLNRSRPVRRDELVEALWADEGLPSGGESLLAPPLSRLRKALGKERLVGRTELILDLGPEARVDSEVAQSDLAAAQNLAGDRTAGPGELAIGWQQAQEAARIFEGGLLPGLEARWIDEHRSHFDELRLRSLETVARIGARMGPAEKARAERAARTAVDASPFRESARAALIEVLEAQGNIAEALRAYEELRVLLREELGTFPAPELTAIYDRLLNAHDTAGEPPSSPPEEPASRDDAPSAAGDSRPRTIGEEIDPRISEKRLVGRDEVLQRLGDEIDRAADGEIRIAILAGEGGVGKTRIAAELAAGREDVTVLYGRCEPDEVRPYRIWSGLLRSALSQSSGIDLEKVVGGDGPTLARLLPELVRRMALPAPGPTADLESERQALFGAVMRMIGRLSAERPMLIILDDLHWADRSTLRLLASLADDNPPRGILALGIYRDTELPRDSHLLEALSQLQRRLHTVRFEVDALDEEQVRDLIDGRVDGSLAPGIVDQSGGNPFFVEQIVRNLQETGATDISDVPPELQEIIAQRVARLPDGGPELLGRAALIGRDFDLDILAQTSTQTDDRIIELLDAAVGAGLLDESGTVPGRYSFVHALVRSSLVGEFSLTRRAVIHRQIGEAIERRNENRFGQQQERDLPSLAWHFTLAGPSETDRAIGYATQAAAQAEGRLAYDEAVDFYEGAIASCRADEPVDQTLLAELLLRRAEAFWRMGLLQRAGDSFFEAARAARESGIPELLARAAIGASWGSWEAFDTDRGEHIAVLTEALDMLGDEDSGLRAQVMANLGHVIYFGGGSSAQATGLVDEAWAMARRIGDPSTEFAVFIATQFNILLDPDPVRRLAFANRCVEIAERSDDPEDLAEALAWRSVVHISAGRGADAAADQARHRAMNETLPQITVAARAMLAVQCFIEGRWEEGERITAETLAKPIPATAAITMEDAWHYMMLAQQGRLPEVIDVLEQRAQVSRDWDIWPAWEIGLILARHQTGDVERARRELVELDWGSIVNPSQMSLLYLVFCGVASNLAFVQEDGEAARRLITMMEPHAHEWVIYGPAGSTTGPVSLFLAEMNLVLGDHRESATYFERAMVTCEAMNARAYLARAQLGLAEALVALGNPDASERPAALRELGLGTAERLGMAPWLERYGSPGPDDCHST